MERRRDGQRPSIDLTRLERGACPGDLRLTARKYELPRPVLVRHDQIQGKLFQDGLNRLQRGQNREHRPAAAVRFGGHQSAAFPRKRGERRSVDPSRRAECGQLAVAVPGHCVRPDPEVGQRVKEAQAHRPDGGLRDVGLSEGVFLNRPFGIAERGEWVDIITQTMG